MHMPQLGELRRVSLTLPMVKANPKVRRVPIDRSHAAAFQKLLSSFDEEDNLEDILDQAHVRIQALTDEIKVIVHIHKRKIAEAKLMAVIHDATYD
ncbi:hypothetical protein DYB34_007430 [Aphanomyces astaci]|uniref:Uncharacterized protein n=1 Tax=Aphanomyces astaci TaxID=112090 RepID=A0A418BTX4_APHAT|nr:hypothetical protein DYB34_007430 [Aphanomyces astaci]